MADRLFREGFLDSEAVNALSDFAERLFVRMVMAADDAGRLDGRIAILRAKARPLDSARRDKDYETALAEIYKAELAYVYEVDGRPYIQIAKTSVSTPAQFSRFPNADGDYGIHAEARKSHRGERKFIRESLKPFNKGCGRDQEALPMGSARSSPTRAGSGSGTGSYIAPSVSAETSSRGSGFFFYVADGTEWEAPAALVEELTRCYPGVNVPNEARAGRAWTLTNVRKRKTPAGMPRFLNNWMERHQNSPSPQQQVQGRLPLPQNRDPEENAKRLAAARAMG